MRGSSLCPRHLVSKIGLKIRILQHSYDLFQLSCSPPVWNTINKSMYWYVLSMYWCILGMYLAYIFMYVYVLSMYTYILSMYYASGLSKNSSSSGQGSSQSMSRSAGGCWASGTGMFASCCSTPQNPVKRGSEKRNKVWSTVNRYIHSTYSVCILYRQVQEQYIHVCTQYIQGP